MMTFGQGKGIAENPRRDLIGTATKEHGINLIIECPDAPDHLKIHSLIPIFTHGAKVGDRVRLVYSVGPSRAVWLVAEILK